MTTVSIFMPNLVQGTLAEASGNTMLLVKPSDKSLLNGAGDSLAWAGNGWLTAEVAEPWTETLSVTVVDGDGLVPFGGWLGVGSVVVADGVAELNSDARVKLHATQPDYAPALAATALSNLVWTNQRAINLDNLDIAISVIQSQIAAQNNLSAKMNISGALLLEVPDSGTRDYRYEIVVRDDEDKLVNLDGVPTIVLTNTAGTDRSALITSAVANVATGRYRLTVTVATGTNNEGLFMSAAGAVSGESRYYSIAPQVVDYDNATQVALLLTRLGTPIITVSADIAAVSTKLGTPVGASVSADIAAVKTDTGNLTSRITSTLFSGITYMSRWIGALAGKTADTATRAEINATTAGAGYNETTDSQEATRDQGDAAWTTGSGGGGGPGDGAEVIVDGFTLDGRAQLLTALTSAQDDGTIDAATCIPVVSGSDWRIDFADIGDLSALSNLIFALKNRASDVDADAVILVDTATGLLRANGAAAGSPAYAAITVDDALTGTGHIIVKAEATANAPAGQKYAGLKVINSTGDIRRAESWRPCITVLNGIVDAIS